MLGHSDLGYLVAAGAAAVGAVVSLWFAQHGAATTRLGGVPFLFFVVPVLVGAIAFGVRGGLISAFVLSGVTALDPDLPFAGSVSHLVTFVLVGIAAGLFVDRNRLLLAEMSAALTVSGDLAASLAVVTDSVADGLVTIDEKGLILRFNASAEKMFGYDRSEVVGKNVSVLIPAPESGKHDGYIADYRRTGEAKVIGRSAREAEAVRKDGSLFPIGLTIGEATLDGQRIFVGAIRDVTERKLREHEHLQIEEMLGQLVDERTAELKKRTEQVEEAHDETLRILAVAAEYRDDETFAHATRVGETASQLAIALGLSPPEQAMIRQAAPLHDLGKIGISDAILRHPGRLTPADRSLMREHVAIGHRIASESHSELMLFVAEIALTHHEWWDGSGYPHGLSGNDIPLCGRIVALADVYDALTHKRPYKRAWPVERAVVEINRLSGRQFDPAVVTAFAQLDAHELAAGKSQATIRVA